MASTASGSSRGASVADSKTSLNSKETSKENVENKENAEDAEDAESEEKRESMKSTGKGSIKPTGKSIKSEGKGSMKSEGRGSMKSDGSESMNSEEKEAQAEGRSSVTELKNAIIVPLTRENILYHYLPLHGAICYSAMSVNVMNPSLFAECCPKKDITNYLLFGSVGGIGLYVYKRQHLQNLGEASHMGYSAFGAVMFTFGSVLIWAVMRSVLPGNVVAGTAFGLLSAAGLLKCGKSYCNAVDNQSGSST